VEQVTDRRWQVDVDHTGLTSIELVALSSRAGVQVTLVDQEEVHEFESVLDDAGLRGLIVAAQAAHSRAFGDQVGADRAG
jgi:hypothetical protein